MRYIDKEGALLRYPDKDWWPLEILTHLGWENYTGSASSAMNNGMGIPEAEAKALAKAIGFKFS